MSKIYIDFDGVILDTWLVISNEYYRKYKTNLIKEEKLKKLMINIGWETILKRSQIINNIIEKIKKISSYYYICILSKINSINEIEQKTKFLISNEIFNMYFVPYEQSKAEYVDPYNNFLIDDDLKNLEEWEVKGGKCIFFNKKLTNYDSYGRINDKYLTINDLLNIYEL